MKKRSEEVEARGNEIKLGTNLQGSMHWGRRTRTTTDTTSDN